ncbi:MAG TPA: hypothetical protein VJY84_01235 [Candidatus Saccharimonadales bacterium]|nr:hypothetical protein [Candidatus Saccharimonadales bacterium]
MYKVTRYSHYGRNDGECSPIAANAKMCDEHDEDRNADAREDNAVSGVLSH